MQKENFSEGESDQKFSKNKDHLNRQLSLNNIIAMKKIQGGLLFPAGIKISRTLEIKPEIQKMKNGSI